MRNSVISRYVPARIKVLAVSPGGSGTTMLMEFLAAHTTCNDPGDRDGLKHFPAPLLPLARRCRVIYLYGDPVAMCVSLFRRGYASPQSAKLNRRLAGKSPAVAPDESIEAFAARGADRLGLHDHFYHWLLDARPYDVAFVRYDSLWETLPELLTFAGLDPDLAREFPTRRKRHGADHLAPATVQSLEEIYAPLRALMAPLGNFHVSRAQRGVAGGLAFLGLARRAALPSLSWMLSCSLPALHRPLRWAWRTATGSK